jgi:hypothetical protein
MQMNKTFIFVILPLLFLGLFSIVLSRVVSGRAQVPGRPGDRVCCRELTCTEVGAATPFDDKHISLLVRGMKAEFRRPVAAEVAFHQVAHQEVHDRGVEGRPSCVEGGRDNSSLLCGFFYAFLRCRMCICRIFL